MPPTSGNRARTARQLQRLIGSNQGPSDAEIRQQKAVEAKVPAPDVRIFRRRLLRQVMSRGEK